MPSDTLPQLLTNADGNWVCGTTYRRYCLSAMTKYNLKVSPSVFPFFHLSVLFKVCCNLGGCFDGFLSSLWVGMEIVAHQDGSRGAWLQNWNQEIIAKWMKWSCFCASLSCCSWPRVDRNRAAARAAVWHCQVEPKDTSEWHQLLRIATWSYFKKLCIWSGSMWGYALCFPL